MNNDLDKLSKRLAANATISDYDFWRVSKTIEQALYMIERYDMPIPIEVLRARNVIKKARIKRKHPYY